MIRISIIIIFALLIFGNILPQQNENPVAIINNSTITAEEFKTRFELSPYISQKYDSFQIDSLKMDFLYSLIAEKIWAIEAEKKGLAQTDIFRFLFQPVEEIILRDALFKKKIESIVKLSSSDIDKGIKKFGTAVFTGIISTEDSSLINEIYKNLLNSSNADSLIKNDPSIANLIVEKEINLGALNDEALEDTIYSLNHGELTKPFKQEALWLIIFIKNKSAKSIDLADQKTVNEIKKIIRNRRIQKKYNEYMQTLLSGKTFSINEESFFFIADKIINVIQSKPMNEQNIFFLSEGDYFNIIRQLNNDELNRTLFQADNISYTVFDFLSNLSFDQFSVPSKDRKDILLELNKKIKLYVEQQVITNEAVNQGLILQQDVKNDIALWKENYLSNLYKVSFSDSVSVREKDVHEFFIKKINADGFIMLNLAVISTNDLDIVSDILDQLKSGKEFTKLAPEFGKTDSLVNEKGITGLTPAVMLADLGNIAAGLKENEVYGPVKRGNNYTIFQVLEKQTTRDTSKISFEGTKAGLKAELINNKLNQLLTGKTTQFIANNQVKIFYEEVNKINVTGIQMFVHRLMGFGGKIAGVPLTTPFSDWINKLELQKLLP